MGASTDDSTRATQPGRQPCDDQQHSYRVLMIAPTSFFADYGCHVRILEEARVLQRLGHRVTIATYANGNPVPGLDIRRTLPIPWRRDYEVGSSRHKIAFDALLGLKTLSLLAREHFDIIHAHLHEGALIGLVLGWLFRIPVVFDFQGSMTGEMLDHHFLRPDGFAAKTFLRLETWIDHRAARILTSTANAERLLIEQFGCQPARVQALPDCVDTAQFRSRETYPVEDRMALRRELGIPLERKLIVYLGLLAEYQGTGLLLEALQRIVRERQDAHLLLMGFPNLDFYRQRAETLGISGFVTFTGRIPYAEAPAYLALGDIAVAPKLSMTEGAGKLLNYMAVGLPTVAFDTPVAREFLAEDEGLAARGDVAGLADHLVAYLNLLDADPARLRALGAHLRERTEQDFSWLRAGRLMEQVYHTAIAIRP